MPGVCVVLDTNAVWDNWLLKGLAWKVLGAMAAGGGDQPVHVRFPGTVLDEAASKFGTQMVARTSQVKVAIGQFLEDGAVDEELAAIVDAFREQADSYRDALEDKLTGDLHAQVLPYPDISHEDMTHRALNRQPPFDENGGGYRDSLIWLAALAEAEKLAADLIIVSNDAAFKAGKGKGKSGSIDPGVQGLAPALVDEAKERGINASLAVSVKELVAALAPPPAQFASTSSSAWHAFVAATGSLEVIEEYLEEHLAEPDVTTMLDAESAGLPADVTDFDINYVEGVGNVKLAFVSALDDGRIACSFTATADVELSVSVYEGTAEMLEWTIDYRYGNGDVQALVTKHATAEGLLTLSSTGEPFAVEDVAWAAEPEWGDYSFADDDCIVVRRSAPRVVTIQRRR